MNTETMIRELKNIADKHRDKALYFGDTNITLMCEDVIKKLKELYENSKEWTPCEEGLPKEDEEVLCYNEKWDTNIIGYVFKDETSNTGYSVKNNFIYMDIDAWMEIPKYKKETNNQPNKWIV